MTPTTVPSGAASVAGTAEIAHGWRDQRLPFRLDAPDAESFELGEKLAADDVHALNQRVELVTAAARPGRSHGAIEVVDHIEEVGQDFTAAAVDVLANLTSQPGARLLEIARRAAIPRDGVLQLLVFFRELLFQLLDVARLERRLRSGPALLRLLVGPPPPIDDLYGISDLFVAHRAA